MLKRNLTNSISPKHSKNINDIKIYSKNSDNDFKIKLSPSRHKIAFMPDFLRDYYDENGYRKYDEEKLKTLSDN